MKWTGPKVFFTAWGVWCVIVCIAFSVWMFFMIRGFLKNVLNQPYEQAAQYLISKNYSPIVVLRQGSGQSYPAIGKGGMFLLVDAQGIVRETPPTTEAVQHGGLIKAYTS